MEKLSYQEADSWFWARTWFWSVPAAALSVVSYFIFASDLIEPAGARAWVGVGVGVVATLLGIFAARTSLQLPWMRGGWRIAFILNSAACIVIAGVIAAFIGAFVMSCLQDNPVNPYSKSVVQAGYVSSQFLVGASCFWAFVFGSWFAMRRDKYFVERL